VLSASLRCTCGATVWLTGLPGAGKTTLARALERRLRGEGRRVRILDADEDRVEGRTEEGLVYGAEDGVVRIGLAAEVLARNGIVAVVPVFAPHADSRASVRARHARSGTPYLEVHVAAPADGSVDPHEAPASPPDLRIDSHRQTLDESAGALYALLAGKGLVRGLGSEP
jgi:adenylylsulfate kinase